MGEHVYCDKHAEEAEDLYTMLPIVNSPRVGICAYIGDAEFEDREWEDDEDEDDEDEE